MAKGDHSYITSQLRETDQNNFENVKQMEPYNSEKELILQTNNIHIDSIVNQVEGNTGHDATPLATEEKAKQCNKCENVLGDTDITCDDESDSDAVIVKVQLKDYTSLESINPNNDNRKTSDNLLCSYKDSENTNNYSINDSNKNNNNNEDGTHDPEHQHKHNISSPPQQIQVATRRNYNTLHFFILFLCAAVMIVKKSFLQPGIIILTILAEPFINISNNIDEHPVTYESKYEEEEIEEKSIEPEIKNDTEETDLPKDFSETQDMVLELPPSGRTLINWLSEDDLYKLKDLASTRLQSIFKSYDIDHKSKTHRKKKSLGGFQGVFKVDLDNLLQQDKQINNQCQNEKTKYKNKNISQRISDEKVPLVICKLISHLEKHGLHEEGILRKAGNAASIRQLIAALDEHFYTNPTLVDEALSNASAHDVASVFKTLIRDLPIPLLTEMHMAAFYKSHKVPNLHERLIALTMLILQLPPSHRDTLYMILELCFLVSTLEASNKMSLTNVATIMAPNLFQPQRSQSRMRRLSLSADKNQAVTDEMVWTSETPKLMGILIKYRELIWTVPHQLITQLRTEYNTEAFRQKNNTGNKQFRQLIWRKSRVEIVRELSTEVNDEDMESLNIILPQFNGAECKVKLSDDTTVKETLVKILGTENIHDSRNSNTQFSLESQSSNLSDSSSIAQNPTNTLEQCTRKPSPQNALIHHALHECGGNIGERLLDPYAKLKAIHQENPAGTFIVKCHHINNEDIVEDTIYNEDTCTINSSSQDDSAKESDSVVLYPNHWNTCIQILISLPIYPSACVLLAMFAAFYSILWEYEDNN